jgi:hypothetical protein
MEFVVSGGTLTVWQDGVSIVSAGSGGGAMVGFGWERFGFKGYEFREVAIQAGSGHGQILDHKVTANYPISDHGPNEWDWFKTGGSDPASNAATLRQNTLKWLAGTGMELYRIEWCPYISDILVVSPRVTAKSNDTENPDTAGAIKLVAYHVPSETYTISLPWTVPSYNDTVDGAGRHFWQAWPLNLDTASAWAGDELAAWRFGFQNTGAVELYVTEFAVEILGAESLGYAPNRTKVI